MTELNLHVANLKRSLKHLSTEEKARSSRRYFPNGVNCCGANAADIKAIIKSFHTKNIELNADDVLLIAKSMLNNAQYNEETLLAFGLINKYVKNNYSDDLLVTFECWLEEYARNWSQVDDLCIKTIFQFLMSRPHLIEKTKHWCQSKSPWCRRASCVVWVKFIQRKIGVSTYHLSKTLIFENIDILLVDPDVFVQKGVGWLLKVTAIHHKEYVISYIQDNHTRMTRSTIRYAIEKMDSQTRKTLLLFTKQPINS